ncbi:hypothetical protein [Paenibacillus sp. MMS20-IR301]|uniref:hypothetical protein n=1 Tax=Paenibacillus sp. MMS20-IR301 TaxID=2895946 RepID=UPI0028E5CA64|nr:hypothetical protein [Paenibacillus sp. MMS20-IR301]WNS43299.1 hypothetical protein LOS79_30910 [Paenibacillus sp. MMS20-IR301]
MKINRQIFERIDNINWFSKCGVPITGEGINQNAVQVSSWEEAHVWYSDVNWDNTTLEARNILTVFLHNKYSDKYQEWNNIARDASGYIESSLSSGLESYREQYNLDNIFVNCVKWDVLNAIMEYTYYNCKKLPLFFLDLLLVYENGNFPCGWDGDYPKTGKLVVY